jgi:hypothetical protein
MMVARVSALRGTPRALLVLALCSCQKGPPPDLVRVELPEMVLSSDPLRPTVHVRRGGMSKLLDEPAEVSVVPPDLASVRKDGTVACEKSGDGRLAVSVLGVKGEKKLVCRLVDRVDVVAPALFDVSGPPVTLQARALAKGGKELADVPLSVTSQSPRLLTASGLTLTPVAVGETSFTVRAGTKDATLRARIVKSVTPEALPLEGGRRIFFSLPEGKFEVEVTLPVEKTLSVEWRGAPYCAYKASAETHRASCTIQGKGGAVVDNPAFLTSGSTDVSHKGISIRQVP